MAFPRLRRIVAWSFVLLAFNPAANAGALGEVKAPIRTVDTGGLETRSAALILSGQEGGELPVAVVAVPTVHPPESSGMDLWVTLPGQGLAEVWPETEEQLIEIYAYVLDETGSVASHLGRAFHLQEQDHRAALAAGQSVTFAARMSLDPGTYSLRILVLLRQSGRLGLRVQPLQVDGEGAAWNPLFLAPMDGFLALGNEAEISVPAPYGPASRVPVEWPELNVFESLHVQMPSNDAQALRGSAVDIHIHDGGGHSVRRVTVSPREVETSGDSETVLLELALESLDLAPGQYRLRLQPSTSEELGETAARGTPWTDVRVAGQALVAVTSDRITSRAQGDASTRTPDDGAASRRPERRLGKAYRGALQRLAAGESLQALRAVMELERRSRAEESASRQAELMDMQASLAAALAEDDAELLVPLLVLHDGLYRAHRRNGDFFLATHSRKLVAYLVDLYLERSTSPSALRVRSEIYTSQAGFLLELGSVLAARNALTAALEDDDTLDAARYLQATIAEYIGDYQEAADVFGELAGSDALDAAGRLRLAVNLRRLGKKSDDALNLLLDLAERPEDDWVAVVALQEAASLLWELERRQEAQDLLRQGMERFPQTPRLIIQLASMLDRSARPGEARRFLARLENLTLESKPTPRLLYSQWPRHPAEAARRALRQRQQDLLPNLAAALESVESAPRAP